MDCIIKYFILRPNYNNENYKNYNDGKRYSEIKYSEIYEIIKNRETNDFYFEEFKKVVKKHSAEYDNELFDGNSLQDNINKGKIPIECGIYKCNILVQGFKTWTDCGYEYDVDTWLEDVEKINIE